MATVARENLDGLILRACQRLGYASIRPNQLKAIRSFMEGNDVFVILSTGSGKSVCFSVLPFAFDDFFQRDGSIVVVVSPLIALMKDQVCIRTLAEIITLHVHVHRSFLHRLLL